MFLSPDLNKLQLWQTSGIQEANDKLVKQIYKQNTQIVIPEWIIFTERRKNQVSEWQGIHTQEFTSRDLLLSSKLTSQMSVI